MGRKNLQTIALLICLAICGCNKPDDAPAPLPADITGKKVFIVCEGSLGNGNSALSLYLPGKDSVYEDIYKAANGTGLGDVFQSMTRIGGQYFLCVNNSDLILVIDKDSWKLVNDPGSGRAGKIGVNNPRYILPIKADKAYVSTIFQNNLYQFNPQTQMGYGSIILPYKNAEGLVRIADTAYVACWDTSCTKIVGYSALDPDNKPAKSIEIGVSAPQELMVDGEGKLWVLSGNVTQGKGAALTRIDVPTRRVLRQYTFPAGADPIRPVFNDAKDTLYFIEVNYNGGGTNNGIYRMGIHSSILPRQPFIAAQGFQYFWALGIQPGTGYIYVGDPKGFTQRGSVSIYKQDGSIVKSFLTGVGPGHFYFDE